ncbi:MAG: hypothetical protein ABH840_00065 [Nanoarchaeota archaeon]
MNLKKAIGLILIITSGILAWSNFIFTGAVVGVSSSLSWIVVIMFIAGIVLMLTEDNENDKLEDWKNYL